ncbi:heparinase II/III-like protein [Pseudoduganella flava]|nr:heparinase II/III family protein [Pseudoduganella flava]TWI41012.1 heparinase II/III-like protein [Pseudoduganella flava]
MSPMRVMRTISAAASLVFATNALAAVTEVPLPEIKTTHPRLYASKDDIDALRAKLMPAVPLPKDEGTVEYTFTPQERSRLNPADAVLFGTLDQEVAPDGTKPNYMFLRHKEFDTGKFGVEVAFVGNGARKSSYIYLTPGVRTTIRMHYNRLQGKVSVSVDGNTVTGWPTDLAWAPGKYPQRFYFVGRKDDNAHIRVLEGPEPGNEIWTSDSIDFDLTANWWFLEKQTKQLAVEISKCDPKTEYSRENVCNVLTAARNVITDAAYRLGLVYQITKDKTYLEAAATYATMINNAPLTAGDEWSMGARVGALGIIYDWFHYELENPDNNPDFVQYAALYRDIPERIVATIRADITSPANRADDDLMAMVCGKVGLDPSPGVLRCNGPANIDGYYISGHNASAMHGMALGLLAIADKTRKAEVTPLLTTIYSHLVNGILTARDIISVDGGSNQLFAYGAGGGEIIERLIMWRRVLDNPDRDGAQLDRAFVPKLIKPFIYGLRMGYSDGKTAWENSYPASGDNYAFGVTAQEVGYMALAAATTKPDPAASDYDEQVEAAGIATTFYEEHVKKYRRRLSFDQVFDELYFPVEKAAPVALTKQPLGARFSVAGNALMRDTWDYDNAALLDFKSTSFSSQNHQHLDQNSFSLFYKAPLLIDSGSYDKYESPHWWNYYRRTIAHNSIVVFDKDEIYGDGTYSNDGGQWDREAAYPTLAQITGTGSNVLGGITAFENGERYSYVVGSASKAYQAKDCNNSPKLECENGFIRSIVYLRPTSGKPLIVVHDRIESPKKLPATALLHSITRPMTYGEQSGGTDGRYSIVGASNPPIVIRNGDGMVTVEPVLPAGAAIKIVGGSIEHSGRCLQSIDSDTRTGDCRFTVRTRSKEGTYAWVNYPYQVNDSNKDFLQEVGAWRIEISPVADDVATASRYQFFLNVLRVADYNEVAPIPQQKTSAILQSSNGSANAVALDANTSVVFYVDKSLPLRWTPAHTDSNVLVIGLKKELRYKVQPAPGSVTEYTVVEAADGTPSSKHGVLYIKGKNPL